MNSTPPKVGFAFSTMERMELSRRSLASLDADGGFDLIWVDGSRSAAGKKLTKEVPLRNCRLVETHYDVRGGPDRAIRYSLRRLLSLGYDYCGLIENDIEFTPGWFAALMTAFATARKSGLDVGAGTVRNIGSRVLECRDGYTLNWNVGAGMVLFTRAAAQRVLGDYGQMSSREIGAFYAERVGYDLKSAWELWMDQPDRALGCDWKYAVSLYKANQVCIGTVPTLARNMDYDVENACRTKYVGGYTPGRPVEHDKPRLKPTADFGRLFPAAGPAASLKSRLKYAFDPLIFNALLRWSAFENPALPGLRQKLTRWVSR